MPASFKPKYVKKNIGPIKLQCIEETQMEKAQSGLSL